MFPQQSVTVSSSLPSVSVHLNTNRLHLYTDRRREFWQLRCQTWNNRQSVAHLKDTNWTPVLSAPQQTRELLRPLSVRIVSLQQLFPLLRRAGVYILHCLVEHVLLFVGALAAHRAEGVQQDFCLNRKQHYNACLCVQYDILILMFIGPCISMS